LGRLTPSGEVTEFPIGPQNSHPAGIVSAPDGKIYFAKYGTSQLGVLRVAG
jgi:virginiamycin B lyase